MHIQMIWVAWVEFIVTESLFAVSTSPDLASRSGYFDFGSSGREKKVFPIRNNKIGHFFEGEKSSKKQLGTIQKKLIFWIISGWAFSILSPDFLNKKEVGRECDKDFRSIWFSE